MNGALNDEEVNTIDEKFTGIGIFMFYFELKYF